MTIGFFAPLPIALMIPFMVAQSLAMMEAAGKGWQYGKRKISAMSNEDFNKLTPHKILDDALSEYKLMIPSMTQAFDESRQLQTKIIEVMVGYAVQLLSDIQKGIQAATAPGGTKQIKNPFVASFLTPAIIPPIPTEDLIPLSDTSIDTTPSTVQDFEEFQQQTEEDKRKQKLRDEAQARFENRQTTATTAAFKVTSATDARNKRRTFLKTQIDQIQRAIGSFTSSNKILTLRFQKATSAATALNTAIQRWSGAKKAQVLASPTGDQWRHQMKLRQNALLAIGVNNQKIAQQKDILAKTKKLLSDIGSF